ncbi:acyltransferase [Paucibacter sp. XJ19-41]|uniref:acyltransferase n=1 Tax=Paucibacter sp. XJ19-41 TaxID=2927824 RepID=UPI00234A4571|nr:acyltransferase [Paucibacter sp. XJ19-41]MDC6166176.1 acyltransferase [Paucibacter sp. XJ19-41]
MSAVSSARRRIKRKVAYGLLYLIQYARSLFFKVISTASAEGRPTLHQPMQLAGDGNIRFGRNIQIGVFPSPFYLSSYGYFEARSRDAAVQVGDGTVINNGFVAIAEHTSIVIGRNVLIGTHVEIYDSDFHGLNRHERSRSNPAWARPVLIGDDVFLGSNVKVLKGVRIGAGSVIANGSVVVRDIPDNVIAGGIPARVIREIP